MKKKILSMVLAGTMLLSVFSGCGSTEEKKDANVNTSVESTDTGNTSLEENEEGTSVEVADENVPKTDEVREGFVLEYPADLQAQGFTEPVVLDQVPERVVCLTAAPVLSLYELGVHLVGVPNSMVVTWPEDLMSNAEIVPFSAMNAQDFDCELVVALEPDLVILSSTSADGVGQTLSDLGLTCYYINAGHVVSYDSIKLHTTELIKAFGVDEESKAAGEAIMDRFAALEERLERAKEAFAGKTVMVLQSGSDAHYIQTANATLGSMANMIGLTNVYENQEASMTQLDFEQALEYQPDLILSVGGESAEVHKEVMEESFAKNPDYWNSYSAIQNGEILYLDVTYCSTAGINVINNINDLIDIVSEHYGITVE